MVQSQYTYLLAMLLIAHGYYILDEIKCQRFNFKS